MSGYPSNARSLGPAGPWKNGYHALPQQDEREPGVGIGESTLYSAPAGFQYSRAFPNSNAGLASHFPPGPPGSSYSYPSAAPQGMEMVADSLNMSSHRALASPGGSASDRAANDRKKASRNCCVLWYEGHFTIDPAERNRLLDLWDMILIVALFMTALLLPFEVALLPLPPAWWVQIQDAINWIFVIDMLVTFNVAYEKDNGESLEEYERAPLKIAAYYMAWPLSDGMRAGWFWPDLFTCLPWDRITRAIEHSSVVQEYVSKTLEGQAITVDEATSNIEAVRIVRLLKLFRIFRLVRVGKLFKRWHTHVGFSYAAVEAVTCIAWTFFTCHWLACAWGWFGLRDSGHNWLLQIATNPGSHLAEKEDIEEANPLMIYNLALYWATMTLTTVGFGDVIPQSMVEVGVVTLAMMLTSFIWASVLGSVVKIIENRDVYHSHFSNVMDDLNSMMALRDVDKDLRRACRTHLHQAYHIHRATHQQKTLAYLSPRLQGKLAIHYGLDTVCRCIPYFNYTMDLDVLVELAQSFKGDLFTPNEFIYDRLRVMVIRRGQVDFKGRLIVRDGVLGIDMIIMTDRLRETAGARTLGFVEVMSLHRDALWEVAERHLDFKKKMRKAQIKLALFRAFVLEGRKRKKELELRARGIRRPQQMSRVPSIKAEPLQNILAEMRAMSGQIADFRRETSTEISSLGARISALEVRMSRLEHKI